MNKRIIVSVFFVVVAAQLFVPAFMIVRRANTLRNGQEFKFRTAPVDPYDAFRGRYVTLGFEQRNVAMQSATNFVKGQKVHATISENDDGFAFFSDVSLKPPSTEPYLTTRIRYTSKAKVVLNIPFDRFYMDEYDAPAAEQAYRKNSRRTNRNAYVAVRVKNGFGVLADLYIDETPIREYLAKQK